MLKHLTTNRSSDRFRGFSYRKVLVDSRTKRGERTKIINWDVYYQDTKLTTLPYLKDVKCYIETKTRALC